jgi:anti-sigma B factor antagonist
MKDDVLEVKEEMRDGICVLTAKGRIDSNSADTLLFFLEKALNEEKHTSIILNMRQVEYLSSIGIRVILKAYKQLTGSGGSFNIENPSEIVKNVLGMAALQEMLIKD